MTVGIVVATPFEAKALISSSEVKKATRYSTDKPYMLAVAGMGRHAAAVAAQHLISEGATGLLSWGVAAGLDPDLQVGSIVIPHVLIQDQREFQVDYSWWQYIQNQLTPFIVKNGPLLHTECILSSAEQKQALFAGSNAIAADMESAAIAAVAEAARVPFLSIRVVSDTASTCVPGVISRQLAEHKTLSILRLLLSLSVRPGEWSSFLKFASDSRLALRCLLNIAQALDEKWAPNLKAAT